MKSFSNPVLWLIMILVFVLLIIHYQQQNPPRKLTLNQWRQKGEQGLIVEATDTGTTIEGTFIEQAGDPPKKVRYEVKHLENQSEKILDWAETYDIPYTADPDNQMLSQLFFSLLLPLLLIVVLWMLLMRQIQGGGNKAMSFGKSRAKLVKEGEVSITFKDVAGVEEAKEELVEIVDYLKNPKKFSRLGGRIPKGVLLVGPPGTGKTLLAKAIAGEASVPFFSISGSDFVEMFVGVGASRVRDLFEQAKKAKPCIIFIDEIDAVGRSRFAGIGGGHDEREQTLNQLLVEMDGFAENEAIILIAATNRPDVLDQALLRPGRFDRQVVVNLPDLKGREQILRVHARKIKMMPGVDMARVAKGTPGFSGADLENLINEAALIAARRDKDTVGYLEFEEAKDRVMMGPERRSLVISEKEKLLTAYHEAGHALVAYFTPGSDPVHKVTIVPRGHAMGVTWVLPGEDRHSMTRQQLLNQLYYAMGGRAAEEIQFSEYTTGAANDLQRVTQLAQKMVCHYGMSDRLGPRTFGDGSDHVFLGKEIARDRNYSEETASIIDEEIKRLIEDAHEFALRSLRENRNTLDRVAEALVERETLDQDEFVALIEGRELPPIQDEPSQEPEVHHETGEAPEETDQDHEDKHQPNLGGPETQPST